MEKTLIITTRLGNVYGNFDRKLPCVSPFKNKKGGGGKGMRIPSTLSESRECWITSTHRMMLANGCNYVYIEKEKQGNLDFKVGNENVFWPAVGTSVAW